jgi:hypothetical protein
MRVICAASVFAGLMVLAIAADPISAQPQIAAGPGAVQCFKRTALSSVVLRCFSSRAVFSPISAADRGGFAPHHHRNQG